MFHRPLEDVTPVVEGATDNPEAVINGVTKEALLRINDWMIGDHPDGRRSPNRNGDGVLFNCSDP